MKSIRLILPLAALAALNLTACAKSTADNAATATSNADEAGLGDNLSGGAENAGDAGVTENATNAAL